MESKKPDTITPPRVDSWRELMRSTGARWAGFLGSPNDHGSNQRRAAVPPRTAVWVVESSPLSASVTRVTSAG